MFTNSECHKHLNTQSVCLLTYVPIQKETKQRIRNEQSQRNGNERRRLSLVSAAPRHFMIATIMASALTNAQFIDYVNNLFLLLCYSVVIHLRSIKVSLGPKREFGLYLVLMGIQFKLVTSYLS